MPHFVIECSQNILEAVPAEKLMQAVYDEAESTGLFYKNDIKVRLIPFQYFLLGENKKDFLHIQADIIEGRSVEQRAGLSHRITKRLSGLLPEIAFLSINIREFGLATYCNKSLIDPLNTGNDRHFNLREQKI